MKALIVEDEEIVRELLESIALREFEFEEVKGAGDGESGWEIFAREPFDFVVMDLVLPRLDGLKLAQRMLAAVPEIRILALSSECDDYTVRQIQSTGILGFVDKNEMSLEVLFEAYNEVSAGHVFYSKNVQEKVLEIWQNPNAFYKILSETELSVIQALAIGQKEGAIAAHLAVSPNLIRRQKGDIMKKLGLKNDGDLVRFALEKGIIKNKGGLNWTMPHLNQKG